MFFKSFDGWVPVGDAGERKMILAKFTRGDDTISHYNVAALGRMRQKPSENMTAEDKELLDEVLREGPSHLKAYGGWDNIGRGGNRIMVAGLVKSSGQRTRMNLTSLQNMAANPPHKFSAFDKAVIGLAIEEAPAFRR